MPTKIVKRPKRRGCIKGRIAWNMRENTNCMRLAGLGFHAKTIAKACKLTVGQVYYRCYKQSTRLRDYRNGKNPYSVSILKKFTVK